jgi:hypothetical protein
MKRVKDTIEIPARTSSNVSSAKPRNGIQGSLNSRGGDLEQHLTCDGSDARTIEITLTVTQEVAHREIPVALRGKAVQDRFFSGRCDLVNRSAARGECLGDTGGAAGTSRHSCTVQVSRGVQRHGAKRDFSIVRGFAERIQNRILSCGGNFENRPVAVKTAVFCSAIKSPIFSLWSKTQLGTTRQGCQ